jgi:hypothetical protein
MNGPKISIPVLDLLSLYQTLQVFRAVNVDSGELIGVKVVKPRQGQQQNDFIRTFGREVLVLGRTQHVSRRRSNSHKTRGTNRANKVNT